MSKRDYGIAEVWREALEILRTPGLLLVTADADGTPNVMTIGWAQLGIVWGKPIMSVFVRPSRYTFDRIDATGDFTVNVPSPQMEDAVQYCGTVSGRDDPDKFASCHMTTAPARKVAAPIIEECLLHYECRTVHKNDVDPPTLAEDIVRNSYPGGDFHRIFFGEIVAVYGVPDFKERTSRLQL